MTEPTGGPTVAVVGLGRMGAAMVRRLRGAGIRVVVSNRTRARAEEVAARTGATVADCPRDAAARGDVVLVSLADDAAVQAVYAGPDGLVAGLRPGQIVLESSTIDPHTVAALEPTVAERGAVLLDTPVSGSVSVVESGQLTVMVGGPAAALETVRPVLDVLAARVFHMGGSGTGAAMKLAVNAVVHALSLALSEALVLAERSGIHRAAAYEVFAESAIAAPFVRYKQASYLNPDGSPVAFSLALVAKDLELIEQLARRVGARMDQTATNHQVVDDAIAAGYADRDLSALASFLRSTEHPQSA
jgi:3-hydroxyisobutyrate dehydrogenase-like beta-hydroxyacid dehydrogenase